MSEDETEVDPTRPERGGRAVAAPRPPRRTGERYRLGATLGKGGMGEVVEAHDEQIGRDVAIKRMRSEAPSEALVRRFVREAKIQGQLEHPAIVPVHELGRDVDGKPYFAMKKLAGTTLADILALDDRTRYPRQRLLRAFADVCLAIELAHARGVVHRDLKPANIMLGDYGETYVLDWGVAKLVAETTDDADPIEAAPGGTGTGAVIGTMGYMAPEQARGERVIGPAADVYALGCVLFEILAGERLHPRGEAGLATAIAGIDARPSVRAPDRDIPPELDALCVHATQIEPRARVPSARELGERVQRFLDGDRDLALRKTLAQEHLAQATRAFTTDDRRTAMREAGRALALDPTLRGAGELIARLMIELPPEAPPEVAGELARATEGVTRRNATIGALSNLAYLLFLPLLAWASPSTLPYGVLIAALAVFQAAYVWRWRHAGARIVLWPVVVVNAALVVVVGVVTSPFLLAIPLAGATVLGLMTGPMISDRAALAIAATMSAAVIAPWLVDGGLRVGDGELVLTSPMFTSAPATHTMLVLAAVAVVFATLFLARGMRRYELAARRHVHLQAWQLRQLVDG